MKSQAFDNQAFFQQVVQRRYGKMKSTFSLSNLKKESFHSLNNHKQLAYIQDIQHNYKLYYSHSITNNVLDGKNKKKTSKVGQISKINKLNNNDFAIFNSFKSYSKYDNLSLNHKINSLLMHLSVNTFQYVFNEILSLGVNNEDFLKDLTSSIFKYATLNPSISFLYSVLSANIASIMKRTKYGDMIEELFEKKCQESFYLPNEDTDKWKLTLLHGIAIFTGNLAQVNLISHFIFNEFAQNLLRKGSAKSLGVLISLLSAGGHSLIQDNKFMKKLSFKITKSDNLDLIETYNSFIQMVHKMKSNEEHIFYNMNEMKLNQVQVSLFTRSDSVPLKLSLMANKMTMDQIVAQYIENPSFSEFTKLLDDNNFSKNSIKTATDLLRSIINQANDNLPNILNLFCELSMYQYFNENQIKIAFSNIINENINNEEAAKSLIIVYCRLLIEEIVTFGDFETLFQSMKNIWHVIIPFFFCEIDNQLGSWVDDMLDNDFWKNLKFIDSNSTIQKMEILEKWNIIDIFPEYDVIFRYYKQLKYNNNKSAEMFLDDIEISIDQRKLSEILFEILLTLDDSQMKTEGIKLKKYFTSLSSKTLEFAKKYGERGLKLASLIDYL